MNIDPRLVVDKYRELGTQAKVGEYFQISQSTVSQILRSQGVRIGRGTRQRRCDHQEVWHLWNEGWNKEEIAEKFGILPEYVRMVLSSEFGVEFPRNHPYKYDLPMDELARRYQDGETCGEIARSLELPSERIRRRLIAHGVEIRSAAESIPRGKKNVFYKNGKGKVEPMHYYRRQSYEVVAICLGRPVPQGWVIHHLDEDPENNDPSNLMLFESPRRHSKFHQRLLRLQRKGIEVDAIQEALKSDGVMLPPPRTPIEFGRDTDSHDLYENLRQQYLDRKQSSPGRAGLTQQ